MEIEDFLKIGRADCSEEDKQKIDAALHDPNFLQFLLETLSNEEVRKNNELLTKVLIAFSYFCKINFSVLAEALADDSLKDTIIQLLFALPPQNRKELVHAFSVAAAAQPESFSEVMAQIIGLIEESTPLADVHTVLSLVIEFIQGATNIQELAELLHELISTLVPAAGAAVASDPAAYLILADTAQIIKVLLLKDLFPIDEVLTDSIGTFIEGCGVEVDDPNVTAMKESILDLFVALIKKVYEGTYHEETEGEEDEEEGAAEVQQIDESKAEIVQLFNESITSSILEGALSVTKVKQSEKMVDMLVTLLYEMLLYNIAPEEICTEEIFTNFIIPSSQLSSSDMTDFSSNQNVYIETAFTDDNDEYMTARSSASRFTRIAAKRYLAHYDPIELLVQFGEDPRDTEGRIFLLCAYASVMVIDPDLFEQIFDLLTTELPPFLVATIIRFVSIIQPKDDPVASSAVASHFILNSEDLVVAHAGVILLNECLNALDDKVEELHGLLETPYDELFSKIHEISESLGLSLEAEVMTKLFRVGGQDVVAAAGQLIQNFFQFWVQSKEESEDVKYIDSVISVIDSIAVESGCLEGLQAEVFGQIQQFITENPHCDALNSFITAAAYMTLKLPTATPEMIQFIEFIIGFISEGNSGVEFDSSLVLLIGGAILHQDSQLVGNGDFIQALGTLLTGVLVQKAEGQDDSNERSPDEISNALILASCVVKLGNADFFSFIDNAIAIIAAMKDKDMFAEERTKITFSAFYLFAAAFIVDADAAMTHFSPEVCQLIMEHSKNDISNLAYRELKVCFITLTFFAKYHIPNSFDNAGNLSARILDADELEERRREQTLQIHQVQAFYDDYQVVAFCPALPFPIEDFSEMDFYQEVCESMPL